ncbi:MAG: PAS domain-containing protein [Calothrix sp. FI2-JRJ7]|jgi:two-component system CheB/CheR fusion protein|nr:PAS domain-containing protein [Calothrix sp. FI2-JRJ7]
MITSKGYNQDFETLLDYLKQKCACDLTFYKRDSLMRRFERRMQDLKIDSYTNYLRYLQGHAEEYTSLLDTILINFSRFFRNRDCWDYLASTIIPQIIKNKKPQEKIRIWSAGCAYGQEVYTLLMLLVEALGIEQYLQRVQIFATDVDSAALKLARKGSYSQDEVVGIPIELLSKYFEKDEKRYIFDSKLRSTIVFGHHNLAIDAPMSKIDLLMCRNVLIYFHFKTQATVFVRFHFALTDKGFLFLGNAENLTNKNIFIPVSLKHRIFAKGEKLTLEDHLLIQTQTPRTKVLDPLTIQVFVWQTAFEKSPFAQLAIDIKGCLIIANDQANALFGLTYTDLGAKLQNLQIGQIIKSLTLLKHLNHEHRALHLQNIQWVTKIGITYLDIHIKPVFNASGKLLGANLTFVDITHYKQPA